MLLVFFKFIEYLFEYISTQYPHLPLYSKEDAGSKYKKKRKVAHMYSKVIKQIDSFRHCLEILHDKLSFDHIFRDTVLGGRVLSNYET
jgi:hypothetical protein